MQARDIVLHFSQPGKELTDRGVQKPIRVLMIGGASMLLLAKIQRSTDVMKASHTQYMLRFLFHQVGRRSDTVLLQTSRAIRSSSTSFTLSLKNTLILSPANQSIFLFLKPFCFLFRPGSKRVEQKRDGLRFLWKTCKDLCQ